MNGIYYLGEVERLYMEASGIFSIFKAQRLKPGLSLLPDGDDAIHLIQQRPDEGLKACTSCGNTIRHPATGEACKHCGNTNWDIVVL